MKILKFVILIAISASVWSCKPNILQEDAHQDAFGSIQALAIQQPTAAVLALPIAEDFIIQQLARPDLNGNNLLFKAVFKPEERRLSNIQSLPIKVGEAQIVLRDDGRAGDELAGDRIFSAFVKEDIPRLMEILKAKNALLERNKQTITRFVGRQMLRTSINLIDLESFVNMKPISIGVEIAQQAVQPSDLPTLENNSLLITDLGVVEDRTRTYDPCINNGQPINSVLRGNPNGAWTFKTLMTNMANTSAANGVDDFVINWVDTQLFAAKTHPSPINLDNNDITTTTDGGGSTIRDNLTPTGSTASSKRVFIAAWLRNCNMLNSNSFTSNSSTNWKTQLRGKLQYFPVRLLAIVNRLDLRGNLGYTGSSNNGGEGRFVFCFVNNESGCDAQAELKRMTIIFEYGIPKTSCADIKNYATLWYNLKNFGQLNDVTNAGYNAALQAITNVFTNVNAGIPMVNADGSPKANGSALNHLRTNEFLMSPWNIRDFNINGNTRQLQLIHPEKEPRNEANDKSITQTNVSALVAFANANSPSIESESNYSIPDNIKGIDAQIPSPSATPDYFWKGTGIINDLTRHKLSLNTCSGCHASETKTNFTHICPTNSGNRAQLSNFLTGLFNAPGFTNPLSVVDPAGRPAAAPATRDFNDLLRRANDLETLIISNCRSRGPVLALAETLRFQPINTTD